jgi:hypothetical protein
MKHCPDLANDVERAHEQLIEVPVHHEGSLVANGVLEHGPDLPLDVLLDIQRVAEQVKPQVRQVVELPEEQGQTSGAPLGGAGVGLERLVRRQQRDS